LNIISTRLLSGQNIPMRLARERIVIQTLTLCICITQLHASVRKLNIVNIVHSCIRISGIYRLATQPVPIPFPNAIQMQYFIFLPHYSYSSSPMSWNLFLGSKVDLVGRVKATISSLLASAAT
jgi:hypothetical protein